jgi:hypothetical protein
VEVQVDTKQQRFDAFRAAQGSQLERILLSLSKKQAFVEALSTSLGQELLSDVLKMYERKLELVIDGRATERDKEALVIFKCLAGLWADKINSYNRELKLIQRN